VPVNIGPGGLAWPAPGAPVSGNVGPRIHPVYGYRSCHTGTDIGAGGGSPILAAEDGVVVSIQNGGPYGLHTLIQHGSGISTMYAHQSSTSVSVGQKVKKGQVIGQVGSTGWSTGPHLHFEVHVNGTPYDPMGWFGGTKGPVGC
jgi:murein DD-endopeptidase MepM/ murein hydrolase activator NlpD